VSKSFSLTLEKSCAPTLNGPTQSSENAPFHVAITLLLYLLLVLMLMFYLHGSIFFLLLLRSTSPLVSVFSPPPLKNVAVFGGSGGVGQLICANFKARGISFRPLSRSTTISMDLLKASLQDIRAAVDGCDAVVIATGTTAFPTKKWVDGNNPEAIDNLATKKIVEAIPSTVKHVVLISSIGTLRTGQFPFVVLNLFGVLDAKREGEKAVVAGGVEKGFISTILRPGRLIGGPWTNDDLAKLFQISNERNDSEGIGVSIESGDSVVGDASRDRVAAVAVKCLVAGNGGEFCVADDNNDPCGSSDEEWGERLSAIRP